MTEIANNNILIAEFMGVKMSDELYKGHPTFVGKHLKDAGLPFSNIMGNCTDNPPFKTSWDWLMPVIDKIEISEVLGQVFNVQINRNKTHILYAPANYSNEKWFENLIIKEGENKLINTYQAVVEFINWYNKQTKEDGSIT